LDVATTPFKPKELVPAGRVDWINMKNRLGNLCLLLASENTGKQDMPVEDWLRSREPGFLKRHLIPEDQALWQLERFPEFLKAREVLIRSRLKTLFGGTGASI
jgi:hypothetical protein